MDRGRGREPIPIKPDKIGWPFSPVNSKPYITLPGVEIKVLAGQEIRALFVPHHVNIT